MNEINIISLNSEMRNNIVEVVSQFFSKSLFFVQGEFKGLALMEQTNKYYYVAVLYYVMRLEQSQLHLFLYWHDEENTVLFLKSENMA